jgi:hypothetical protein
LLGNGLSINVWPRFAYRELYEHAVRGGLTDADRALFRGTPNFELVLGELLRAIRICDVVGVETKPLYERYRSIQRAAGRAVREVHVNRDRVPGATRAAIREQLKQYEWVFTTSYDLLIYWSMAYPHGDFTPFKDHFRWGGRCEFAPDRAPVFEGDVPVYFLHGALHLVVGGSGVTWKLRRTALQTLLDQFGKPIQGDDQARPLLVTEGSARDKLQTIEGNAYLSHALGRLQRNRPPMVVFGSRLSEQDHNIVDALNLSPERPIAVSLLPSSKADLLSKQLDIYGRLKAKTLLFFDARSHPLGAEILRVPGS